MAVSPSDAVSIFKVTCGLLDDEEQRASAASVRQREVRRQRIARDERDPPGLV